jgi:hypothetical protein
MFVPHSGHGPEIQVFPIVPRAMFAMRRRALVIRPFWRWLSGLHDGEQ